MSGFHPVLGLLAVAVCISCAEGAPSVHTADIFINRLLQMNPRKSASFARDDSRQPSASYNKNNQISKRDEDNQTTDIIDRGYAESLQQGAISAKFSDLKSKGDDGTKPEARDSGSGALDRNSREDEDILSSEERSNSEEDSSRNSVESGEDNPSQGGKPSQEMGLPTSNSEEECEEDEGNNPSVSDTPKPTVPPTQPNEPTQENDGCEEEEGTSSTQSTVSESSPPREPTEEPTTTDDGCEDGNPSESSSSQSTEQSAETEEPDRPEDTPTSPTRRPTRKPNTDDSSLSFHASDNSGVEFSNSFSEESKGTSTELND